MLAFLVLETVAIALLAVLVAGLLRSHAEILRQLHHLGINLDPDRSESRPPGRPPNSGRPAHPIQGETPDGEVVTVALDRPGERTLLLFLSSGCSTCVPLWDGLDRHSVPGARVVVVTRGPDEESPAALSGRAPRDVTVVMSSAAWDAFEVPGSPYAVLVEAGAVVGQGVSHSWHQLGSLVGQHMADVSRPKGRPTVDDELIAAGIHPGHPSLHPQPRA